MGALNLAKQANRSADQIEWSYAGNLARSKVMAMNYDACS
jgi:hypothetical protein